MSYDLLVFNPDVAPRDRDAFMLWYRELVKWGEQRDYSQISGASGNLPDFYERISCHYKPMNGPNAYVFKAAPAPSPTRSLWAKIIGSTQVAQPHQAHWNEELLTDYSIAEHAIYMSFSWSINAEAYSSVVSDAIATGVGFFDVSAQNGDILHDVADLRKLAIL